MFWTVKLFLLFICESTRFFNHKNVEEQAKESNYGIKQECSFGLQALNHIFCYESYFGISNVLAHHRHSKLVIVQDFWDVYPEDSIVTDLLDGVEQHH